MRRNTSEKRPHVGPTADDFEICCDGADVKLYHRDVQHTLNGGKTHTLRREYQGRCSRCGRVLSRRTT